MALSEDTKVSSMGWPDRTGADRPSSRYYQDHRALWLGPIRDLRRLYEQPAAPQPS